MNTFKRKSLYTAVLASLGTLGVAGTAQAVHVNPDGLGQVLIYPYYTVRSDTAGGATGPYNTYLSVINTTASAKAVKVRFLEGKNSREVLDFNLFLSPYDMWTAAVLPTADGARIITNDKSCTTGVIPAAGQPFSNGAYTGPSSSSGGADGETGTLDRTREGYFEMLEMGVITNPALITAVTHNPSTKTPTCTAAVLDAADGASLSTVYLAPPSGGLAGTASLLNPNTGADYTYDAVAIDNWAVLANGSNSASILPTIADGSVYSSDVFNGGSVVRQQWGIGNGRDAVSAAIMRNNVINEYVLDAGTTSGTDWVVTFPTKRFYVRREPTNFANIITRSHTFAFNPFNENFGAGGSCDDVFLSPLRLFDREESTSTVTGFSPQVASNPKLCWEANVISFNAPVTGVSSVLGSINVNNIATGFPHGWMNLGLSSPAPTTFNRLNPVSSTTNGVTDVPTKSIFGLPVVGFMVQDFINGTLSVGGTSVLSTWGGNFIHKYTRSIGATPTSPQ